MTDQRYGIWHNAPQWKGWAVIRVPHGDGAWDRPLDFSKENADAIVAITPGTEARLLTVKDMAGVFLTANGAARSAAEPPISGEGATS